MRATIGLLACLCIVAADDKQKDLAKKDIAQLQGEWTMVSGERDGQALPENIVSSAKRIVKDDEITLIINDQTYLKAKFKIDPTKKPKTIDYTITEGQNKDAKQVGIYELSGDNVKFCFSSPGGKDRPTDFTTKEGSDRILSVWKRNVK